MIGRHQAAGTPKSLVLGVSLHGRPFADFLPWTNQRARDKVNRLRAIAGHEFARIGESGSQPRSVTWASGLTKRSRQSGEREDVTARLLSVNVGLPRTSSLTMTFTRKKTSSFSHVRKRSLRLIYGPKEGDSR
jgi:hypothetical protein